MPRAHRPEESGQHVLHEHNFAVPLQRATACGVFPLRKVQSSPTQVSWFVHPTYIFLLGTAVFLPKDTRCRENGRGSHLPAPHQAVTVELAAGWSPSPSSESFPCWVYLQHYTFLCRFDGNTSFCHCCLDDDSYYFLVPAEPLKPNDRLSELYCTCVYFLSLCITLPFEGRATIFSCFTWNLCLFFPSENGESATAFGCLMSDMWLGEFDCLSPEVFHSVLGKRYPTFSKRTQQDAQEFLICVLNELHEALKKVRAPLWCFGDRSCFLFTFHDLAFHVIIAQPPLPNYMMRLLKIVIFFLCFLPTYTQ